MKYLLLVFLLLATSLMAKPPFLSQGYIPHYTKKIAKNWDNDFLDLTAEQKTKLIKVRKDTMKAIGNLKTKLQPLEQELADKVVSGVPPKQLRNLVKQIAKYKEAATMVHLRCVSNTQKILTKEQLDLLPSL